MSDPKPEPAGSKAPAVAPPSKAPQPGTKMTLDAILINEVGDTGRFQLQTVAIVMVLALFTGVSNQTYIFFTAKIETRCLIPECDSTPPTYKPSWLMNAIPPKDKKHDFCNRYAPMPGAPPKAIKEGTCPREMFDTKKKIPCKEFVHVHRNSVVYDFQLECKEWSRTFLGMMRKFGTVVALPITSYMSDRWGRRVALVFNSFCTAIIGTLRYWVQNYVAYFIVDFLEGCLGSGVYSCAYVLMVELFGPKWRVAAGASVSSAYSFGQVVLGLCAWKWPHWRFLTLLTYIPQFVSIFAYCTMTESVRWYLVKGKYDTADALLRKAARINGRSVQDSSLASLRLTYVEAQEKARRDAEQMGSGPSVISQVLSHKRVLLRVLVSPIWWITTTFIYHGLALNATAVISTGNPYQNYIIVTLFEIPGFWTAFFLLNRVGRKPVLTAGYWTCGICLLSYMFIPIGFQLPVYMVAKLAIAMVVTSVYTYTAELYPTNHRHKLLALASAFGRIGSICAPLTPALAHQFFYSLPFLLFGGMASLSGVLIFFTPETLGTAIPDNFEQAENLGKKERATTT